MTTDTTLAQAREHFLAGIADFEAGRLEPACAAFEAALALAPGRASVLANLGVTLFKLKRWSEAVPRLREAVAADPSQTDAWFALGLSLQALAEWSEAAQALERGLALDPSRTDLWLVCAQCHANAGRGEAALRAIDRVLAVDPDSATAWSERGGILRDLGHLDEAAASYGKALALGADPELHRYYLAATSEGTAPAHPPRLYVEALFDQYAADFEKHLVGQLQYRGHEWLLQPLIESGQRWRRVLDLGCGTGLCGALVAPQAEAIVGVDLSSAMLAQARERGIYRELIQADLLDFLRNASARADLVLAADVFIYVGALEEVFGTVRRLLEPGGCFAFTVERAADGDDFRLQSSLRYAHSEAYLRRLAETHGFTVTAMCQGPLRQNQQQALDALYVYLT